MLERWRSQTNLINVAFAALLFLSPWFLGFAYEASGINAWLGAVTLGLVSVLAILSYAEWEEWADLAVGAWILISPSCWKTTNATTVPRCGRARAPRARPS